MKLATLAFCSLFVPLVTAGGRSGSKSGSNDISDPCDICKDGRPDSITFKYVPADPSTHAFEKHTCAGYLYPGTATIAVFAKEKDGVRAQLMPATTVNDGDTFTVNGPFEADSFFVFDGWTGLDNGGNECIVHTSCSDSILPGYENRIGPFEIVGPECVPKECDVCDSGKPKTLTLKYRSDGQTSIYQSSSHASCVANTYPTSTTITYAGNKEGLPAGTVTVNDGDEFTLTVGENEKMDAETHFDILGFGSCHIHTSCSAPLVPGDVIGPFEIVSGNDCGPPEQDVCIMPDKASYACGEAMTFEWDYSESDMTDPLFPLPHTALRDDWIGIYPCNTSPAAFFHAKVWQFTCGLPLSDPNCVAAPVGSMTFDSLPAVNQNGPHAWPVQGGCYKAVLLRNDGPSVPPYIPVCQSASFDIVGNC